MSIRQNFIKHFVIDTYAKEKGMIFLHSTFEYIMQLQIYVVDN